VAALEGAPSAQLAATAVQGRQLAATVRVRHLAAPAVAAAASVAQAAAAVAAAPLRATPLSKILSRLKCQSNPVTPTHLLVI
jgi:hypothetical protein